MIHSRLLRGVFFDDVCQLHTVLEDYDRDVKYRTRPGGYKCDRNLYHGWYRFLNISGITMPTTCPHPFTCGTVYPVWLMGGHPTVEDGEVAGIACFSKNSECCKVFYLIRVRNCTSFYVYFLKPTVCPYRYCFTYN